MTGIVYGNDAQIVATTMWKRYCDRDARRGESPGAQVTVQAAEVY